MVLFASARVQVLAVKANTTARDLPYSVPLTAAVRLYLQFLPYEEPVEVMAEVRRSFDRFCAVLDTAVSLPTAALIWCG